MTRGLMDDFEPKKTLREIARAETADYIYDLIEQIAHMARDVGETHAATHLEGILIAQRAIEEARSRR